MRSAISAARAAGTWRARAEWLAGYVWATFPDSERPWLREVFEEWGLEIRPE